MRMIARIYNGFRLWEPVGDHHRPTLHRLHKDDIVDEAVEEIRLHDNGERELTTRPVAVGPVHKNYVGALHGFFR